MFPPALLPSIKGGCPGDLEILAPLMPRRRLSRVSHYCPWAHPFGESSPSITIELTFHYDRAPSLGPQRKGELGTVQMPFSSHIQAKAVPAVSRTSPTHCLEIRYPLLAQEQGSPITGQSKANGESRETGRHTLPVNNIHQNIYHYDGACASYSSTGERKEENHCRKVYCPELVSSAPTLVCTPGPSRADLARLL